MNSSRGIQERWIGRLGSAAATVMALAICLGAAQRGVSQVKPSGDAGGLQISAGAAGSAAQLQYGERKMLGITGFVDVDTLRRIGLEGEVRMLEFHQSGDVHAETYSGGVRYHMNFRRFQPYAKGLIGIGAFNFPYNLATGSFLVATAGGGVDYRLTKRIYIRAADAEYQIWPQFTFGSMTVMSVSAGVRVRVFGHAR